MVWATLWVAQAIAKDWLKNPRNSGSIISDEAALKKRYMQSEESLDIQVDIPASWKRSLSWQGNCSPEVR